jgi:ubiquinone/menaquinone biosynthesis C-methylase UbiE
MEGNWTKPKDVIFNRSNALGMDELAKTVFAPVYPMIARNAVVETGINKGLGLELGSGPGMFSIAMAQESQEMNVIAMDFSDVSKYIAKINIAAEHMEDRIYPITGDVHALPFEDDYANLIFSRGSMFFWKDLRKAFTEIYRVLSPGGATYIGGGFGTSELKKQVTEKMLKINPQWSCYAKKKADDDHVKRFETMFNEIGCQSFRIINDESGFWVVLYKNSGK